MKSSGSALLLLSILALSGCRRDAAPPPADTAPPVAVKTGVVADALVPRSQPVPGTVRPRDRAVVAAKLLGSVADADLAVGQTVRAGDVLVTLRADELTARVEQARAALNQARRDHEREARLLEQGAATAETVRSLADRERAAAAALHEAETMLGYTQVQAPFDGVVTRDLVNTGDLAAPGQPLFELEGTRHLRVEAHVPESLVLPPPDTALEIDLGGSRARGTLAEISPAANPVSRTRLAILDLPDSAPARSGQFVRVLWPAGEARELSVPREAITVFGQMERVFVVQEGRARLRLVKSGRREGDRVILLAGVEAGERVVLQPPATLRDGQAVEEVR